MFSAGQEIENFLISYGILFKAWEESLLVSDSESFRLTEYEDFACVTFPSFHKIEGFIVEENEYGECNIQTDRGVFSAYLKGSADQPALVHQGALNLFLNIMEETDFQAKMQVYTDSKQRKLKPIIFVGHSLGGAVATLATLWVLEKRLRQSSPFCITFGCPLVGDVNLVEAVGVENWGGNFLHVISQHDIVPRMLLAPLKSIAQPLTAILPYWHGKIAYSFIQDACRTLLNIVLQCTYTVDHGVDSSGRSDGVIKRSPYKPFGTYMFFSSNGAACFDDSETVLKLLSLTMRSYEELHDNILKDWFSEHIDYGPIFESVLSHNISGSRIAHSNSESSLEVRISLQRAALGVEAGTQDDHMGRLLSRAVERENYFHENVDKVSIELSNKWPMMAIVEHYKGSCENKGGIGYYDSFKNQNAQKDISVDQRRLHLARFWDEIIEMCGSRELPVDFQSQNKWINAGTFYRKLVEPLDIAHYYRVSKGKGNYLSDGRPNRYKVLQEWMEAKEKTRSSRGQRSRTKPASLTEDSCFWARVEEARKDLEKLKQGQYQSLQNLENFEVYVTVMENSRRISPDTFLAGSSFILWWEDWKEYNINKSPEWRSSLYGILENKSRFEFESIKTPLNEILENESPFEFEDIKTPLNEMPENESPFESESIKSDTSDEESDSSPEDEDLRYDEEYCSVNIAQDNIPSTGEVKVPSTKEADFDQLSSSEIELTRQQGCMFELEWYKMICHEKGDGYYDSFKNRNDNDSSDSKSILLRVTLNDFWEGIIIRICNSGLLPNDFQSRNMWINAGTAYRKLVEPLDIADHYSKSSKDSGSYLHKRPARYEVLEQWLKHRKENRSSRGKKADHIKLPFLTRDSCFWARVEDAMKELEEGADQKKASLENFSFEKYVTEMINDCKISSDVLLEGSSFMKWWRDYKRHQTSGWNSKSPLYNLKSPFWKP